MKPRVLLHCSIGLNATLVGVLWWLWTWPRPVDPPQRPLRAASAREDVPSLDTPESAPAIPAPEQEVPFHWSQIASTNFIRYRDALRAVGCPEQTVRDIIESEINAFFAQRRRPLVDALQPQFWDAIAQGGKDSFKPFEREFEALREERREVLAKVLGERPRGDEVELADSRTDWARDYAWLPAAEQEELVGLEEQRWRQIRALETEIGERAWTPEEQARRREIDEAFTKARREALGEHLADFELRVSAEGRWAEGAAGFEPTEAEWRAATEALRREKAERQSTQPRGRAGTAGTGQPINVPAEAARRLALQTTLGPERYAEYERASSGSFQQTRRVTRRLGFADDLAVQAWEIERAASSAAAELRANASLDPDRRQNALSEVNLEAMRSLRQVLGEEGLGVYRKYAGDWLGTLAPGE